MTIVITPFRGVLYFLPRICGTGLEIVFTIYLQ